MEWGFYGRKTELAELSKIVSRQKFFFAKIEGRRRIGKTRLLIESFAKLKMSQPIYCKIQDANEEVFCEEWRAALAAHGSTRELWQPGLRGFAQSLCRAIEAGHLVVLDEFQYLSRERLRRGLDFLQEAVDTLRANPAVKTGLIVMGSLATELDALIDNRHSPLFGRTTDALKIGHWGVASLFEMWKHHAPPREIIDLDALANRILSFWNVFEGVPKFYQDAHTRGVLNANITELVQELFLSSNAPLAAEGENWLLRELRGNYWAVLRYISENEGRSHADIVQHIIDLTGDADRKLQIGGYLQGLERKFELVESRRPLGAEEKIRKRKYYLKDRFLRTYLSAILPAIRAPLLPLELRMARVASALDTLEGKSFEMLLRQGLLECAAMQKPLIGLHSPDDIGGYWKKEREVDMLAIDRSENTLWVITCKRHPAKHSSANNQNAISLAEEFLRESRDKVDWMKSSREPKLRMLCASPFFDRDSRIAMESAGARCISLADILQVLG